MVQCLGFLPTQALQLGSLVGELGSHVLCVTAKK